MPIRYGIDYSSLIFLIPALIFTLWAQWNVKSTYRKYAKIPAERGITGSQAARMILDRNGLQSVRIEKISGELTDHYDPKANVIRLSDSTYGVQSAAAVGVAAHEAGHAIQHAVNYAPIRWRTAIIPITNIGSNLAWPLVLIGLLFSFQPIAMIGVIFFGTAVLFQLVTLPVEFNASRRALSALTECGFSDDGLAASKKVLTAAALTYVAALASSVANFLRLLSLANSSKRR